MPNELHYYRCRNCAMLLIVTVKTPSGYESCNGCRSYMKYLFSEPVTTPEQVSVWKMGKVYRYSPSVAPLKRTPSLRDTLPVVTPEEGRRLSELHRARMRRIEMEDEERHEAACENPK